MSIPSFCKKLSPAVLGLMVLALACGEKKDTSPPEPAASDEAKTEAPVNEEAAEDDADAAAKVEEKDEPAPAKAAATGDVLAVLAATPNTKIFAELIPLSDYGNGLHAKESSGFTLLAPSDDAFAKLPKGTIERWKKKPAELDDLIRHHVILGTNDVGKLGNFRTAPTAAGRDLEVKTSDNEVTIAGAKLIDSDRMASNGVVHVIDKVLKK